MTIGNGNSRTIFPYSHRKTRSNGPLFDLTGATVPDKQSHLCRRKPNRIWEAGHQECGDPPRERSRDRDLENLVPEGWPNVEGDRVAGKEGDRATVVTRSLVLGLNHNWVGMIQTRTAGLSSRM